MKRLLVALVLALVPLTYTPAQAATTTALSGARFSAAAARPTICFEFAFWKYCI